MRHVTCLLAISLTLCVSCGPLSTPGSDSKAKQDGSSSSFPQEQLRKEQVKTLEDNFKKVNSEANQVRDHITRLYEKANIHVYSTAFKLKGEALRDQYRVLSMKRVLMMDRLDPQMQAEILKWEEEYLKRWEYAENAKRELDAFRQGGQWKPPAETPPLDTSAFVVPDTTSQPTTPSQASPPIRSAPPTPPPSDFNPVGKTEIEVTGKWGPPTGRVELGSEVQLIYPHGRITIEDDKVTSYKQNE